MPEFSFPHTELTADSVVFNHSLDSIYDCSELGDALTEVCRMINDRYLASHRDPVSFPFLGTDCAYGTLASINYDSDPTKNPAKDFEKLLTFSFSKIRILLSSSANRYLKSGKALVELYQDLDVLALPDWYQSGFSHDPIYNWYFHSTPRPEDSGWVSHQYQHRVGYRSFLDVVPYKYQGNSLTYHFPHIESWKRAILAYRKALTTISGDRITSSAGYKSYTAVAMLDKQKTFTARPANGISDVRVGVIDPASFNEDETAFRIDPPYNSWPPIWEDPSPYGSPAYLSIQDRVAGFVEANNIQLTPDENGAIWIPYPAFGFNSTPRWYAGSLRELFYYKIGFVSSWYTLGNELNMQLPPLEWTYALKQDMVRGEAKRLDAYISLDSGTFEGASLLSLSSEEIAITSTVLDSSIPIGASPLEYMDRSSYNPGRFASEWGLVRGPALREFPTLYLKDASYVFYRETTENIICVSHEGVTE